jgi:hypothetical protein
MTDRWNEYLADSDPALVDLTNAVFTKLNCWHPGLAEPDLCPMEDGDQVTGMFMAFDDGKNYLTFEIFNGGLIEIFYRNRVTNFMGDWEYPSLNDMSHEDIGEYVQLYVVNRD